MWKIKVLVQFFLSKIPGGEKLNYYLQTVNKSHNQEQIEGRIDGLIKSIKKVDEIVPLDGATVVEIGTGWEPICSTLLYLMGVKTCHTYDHVPHVRFQLITVLLRSIENKLLEISKVTGIPLNILIERLSILKESTNVADFFSRSNTIYNAPGDGAKTLLDAGSVDLVYSHAVLEHVPEQVVYDISLEAQRILKSTGVAYHLIGLHDHYVKFDKKITKVNFLKYPEYLWAFFVKNNISYHNRLRERQFLDIFKKCGAKVIWLQNKIDYDDINYLKDIQVDKFFRELTAEELAVYQTELILSFNREE